MIDEGGTTEKVSGKSVPTGSLKKEVRDDIPINLVRVFVIQKMK